MLGRQIARNLRESGVARSASSETKGQSVGSGEKTGRKFSSKGGKAPGYRLLPILGDPGEVSRAGLKGATKVFKQLLSRLFSRPD